MMPQAIDELIGGLSPTNLAQIQTVLTHYPAVQQGILYGSRAKGTYKRGSDIDLTLIGDSDQLSWSTLCQIENELDDLFLPYMFDLSLFDTIDEPQLRAEIERTGICIYDAPVTTN
jgi:uncharacterized protein